MSVLEQGYSGADIGGMLQVMAANEDGCTCRLGILTDDLFQRILACRVEEIKRFVKHNKLRLGKQS